MHRSPRRPVRNGTDGSWPMGHSSRPTVDSCWSLVATFLLFVLLPVPTNRISFPMAGHGEPAYSTCPVDYIGVARITSWAFPTAVLQALGMICPTLHGCNPSRIQASRSCSLIRVSRPTLTRCSLPVDNHFHTAASLHDSLV